MGITDDFLETVSHNHNHNTLSFKFFIAYARFEYALKRAGFVFTPPGKQYVQASTIDFGNSIKGNINLNDESIKSSVDYLVDNPPNELLLIDDELLWMPLAAPNRSVDFVLKCMRTIRNNMFHGNKQMPGNSFQRTNALIQCSLALLNFFLSSSPQVTDFYLEYLE